ncbi:DNA cytosine methyltransferase [Sporolactobacillus sp. STCC-11]|uniref:DNA cytosine methyltransferase n=1 Tax=Sporolactobacillus caesalpiniae TaxID=3230362 RepID=UPI00339616B6
MIFRNGELFSGPGGLALGAVNAGFVDSKGEAWGFAHAWANDYDQDTVQTYKNNILHNPDAETVFCMPVERFPIGERNILGEIDALTFGFPCNDFSNVGEQRGLDGRFGPLYTYGVRVLREYQPRVFIAENVGGLSSANEGEAFIQILTEFENQGYTLVPNLYKFEEYGIPQARHRIMIVGIRNDLDSEGIKFHVPAPTAPNSEHYRTCYDALMTPPIPDNAPNHEKAHHTNKVKEMLSFIPEGENAWYIGIPEELRLNVKGARLSSIYKRLDRTKPSYTVTGSGGGGTSMYHWSENRALTNRERARLQTFPDDFVFVGNKESVRKQVGMAVPPKGAEIVLNAVLKTFAHIDYDYVDPTPKLQLKNLRRGTGKNVQLATPL